MRPAPFAYRRPTTIDEACAALAAAPGEARALAGGVSLVQQLNARRVRPAAVIDLGRVDGLDGVAIEGAALRVGAMVSQRALELHAGLERLPALARALACVGHVPTRNRGTVGGSIAFADPTAELPCALLGLGGSVRLRGADGEREVAAADLFIGPWSTALRDGELICELRFPLPRRAAFAQRHFRRHAKVSALAADDRLAVAGIADRPLLVDVAGDRAAVMARVRDAACAGGDRYASIEYRRRLAAAVVGEALDELERDA